MRLIVPAVDLPAAPSFFVWPVVHPSPAEKASKLRLPDSFSASPSAFTPSNHVRRSKCTAGLSESGPCSWNGRPAPLHHSSSWQRRLGPADGTRHGWEAGHAPLRVLHCAFLDSGGRSCSSGLSGPPSCQYRQPKPNKDVYWQPNERIGPGDLTLMNGPPRCFQ